MSRNVEIITAYLKQLSGRMAQLSKDSPPPHTNQANGYFRQAVLTDQITKDLPAFPVDFDISEEPSNTLLLTARDFQGELVNAFTPPDQDVGPGNYPKVIFQVPEVVVGVIKIVGSIIGVIVDSSALAAAAAEIEKDINDIANATDRNGPGLSGDAMNGFISVNVQQISQTYISKLSSGAWDPNTQLIASALLQTCNALAQLNTTGHDPWLLAEWQIGFQGIMEGLNKALS